MPRCLGKVNPSRQRNRESNARSRRSWRQSSMASCESGSSPRSNSLAGPGCPWPTAESQTARRRSSHDNPAQALPRARSVRGRTARRVAASRSAPAAETALLRSRPENEANPTSVVRGAHTAASGPAARSACGMSTRESSRVGELPPSGAEASAPPCGGCAGNEADDGRPWTELETQTLIYSQEVLDLGQADFARHAGRSPQALRRRCDELAAEGRLRPRAGETGRCSRTRRSWDELRPAIRGLYEENVPRGTIGLMLGITPTELGTQLRRLFHEGLPRR